ncbi:hypothetical protein EJ06DRAFT_506057 [Trichodelitschia bisporula]|uniref:Membrane insertase YidC/Oxa/ALB C-terminal domain-containing protein n=1 Tax=Trichodelitschia bisporula TaxID=703511 RepID=A0A6G1I3V6_9PEZI|nr:hypothetical protein EJ06DRAFT_506057 [Trichodelitschia bisporula]
MIPSRGMRYASATASRLVRPSGFQSTFTRQFSNSPARHTVISQRVSPRGALFAQVQAGRLVPSLGASALSSVPRRFQSTAPSPPSDTAATAPPASPSDASTPTFEPLPDFISTTPIDLPHVVDIPERIGFLKELGLDYGWGPTSMIEWILEHVHIYAGTPWWASIALTAAAWRIAMIYPYVKQSDQMAKMGALKGEMDRVKAAMDVAKQNQDPAGQQKLLSELRGISIFAGLDYKWMYGPMLVQTVFGFCTFKLLRAMSVLPVPGLETGGFLWVSDLTQTDPYFILPLMFVGVLHMLGRRGGESGAQVVSGIMKPMMLYVVPGVFGTVTAFMPVALQLSFLVSLFFGVIQSQLLQSPDVRRALGLAPLVVKPGANPSLGSVINVSAVSSRPTTPSRLNVIQSYKAPTVKSTLTAAGKVPTAAEAKKSKGALEGMISDFKGAKQEFGKFLEKAGGQKKSKDPRRTAEFLRTAEAYEKRRKQEVKEAEEMMRQRQ